jgi:hypothetical protein
MPNSPDRHSWKLMLLGLVAFSRLFAQSYGTIRGSVADQSGAVIAGATVEIQNPVSHYARRTKTDADGSFSLPNVPFNLYHVTASASGFAPAGQDVDVRSSIPVDTPRFTLQVGATATQVSVEATAGLVEADPTSHTEVDRGLFDKLPLESSSSSLSSLVTLASPGIAADSNGLFHGMGDHASNSFSVDGQPITDQQSKVFSNQIPLDSVQSMNVIQGAPPAEYGGKTSVIIDVTTRSGQGVTTPHGEVDASYGSFGTAGGGFNLGYGGQTWGNFISANGLNSGRFLDPPEFTVMHDHGNEENLFDRIDYQGSSANTFHLNLGFTRSWFQTPNTYDEEYHPGIDSTGVPDVNPLTGAPLGPADQRSQIKTFNIAPTFTHIVNASTLFTIGAFWRQDQYNYYPSANPFDDFSPDLSSESITQSRRLLNAGVRSNVSYVKGIHNVKAGVQYEHTFLTEGDSIGIVDPGLAPSFYCQNPNGSPIPGTPCAVLAPYDLTEGGQPFLFYGHTDIKELAVYAQDTITKGAWTFNLGLRGDVYRGLAGAQQAEPRLGIAYNIKPSGTVLRVSYARTMETPFNENLIIGSEGCNYAFLAILIPPPGVTCNLSAIHPGHRNEFHAGLQQAFGRYLVVDASYVWKYTHDGYDFGIVGSTPITFPIEWSASKIPGWILRTTVPDYHGFTAQVVMSGVAARFYGPQVAGVPIIPASYTDVFRIDHDERYNQTTHLQYQPWRNGPWLAFNWRYDSGLVAGATPCDALTLTCIASTSIANGGTADVPSGQVAFINTTTRLPLTADQEYQGGFTCNGNPAASSPLGPRLASCDAAGLGSIYIQVPTPGKENDDHDPQRVQPRNLFDLAIGHDNIFRGDRYRFSARISVVNLTNKVALYNFLSTFSGTHYVSPRSVTGTIAFHF